MKSISVLGSCVSRVALTEGNLKLHGTADEELKIKYYFDKCNIVCCMMPKPFKNEWVDEICKEELYDPSRIHSLKEGIKKEVVPILLSDPTDYLIIDLYDFHTVMASYNNTCFSTNSNEFFNTKLYQNNKNKIKVFNFLEMPSYLWYGYVDLFFEIILKKYDNNHIILNRLRATSHYFTKEGKIKDIPETFKMPYHANIKYNDKIRQLEEYIIYKYNIYVIDFSKYFLGDESLWDNLNGSHFEKDFYEESFKIIKYIVNNQPKKKYFDILTCNTVLKLLFRNTLSLEEYKKYRMLIDKPKCGIEVIDDFIGNLSDEDIMNNKKFLFELYNIAGKNFEKLYADKNSNIEKVEFLFEKLKSSNELTASIKIFQDNLRFIANYLDCKDLRKLLSLFKELLNNNNLMWINVLNHMEKIFPYNKEVVKLKLDYYKAIDDKMCIKKYENKLEDLI